MSCGEDPFEVTYGGFSYVAVSTIPEGTSVTLLDGRVLVDAAEGLVDCPAVIAGSEFGQDETEAGSGYVHANFPSFVTVTDETGVEYGSENVVVSFTKDFPSSNFIYSCATAGSTTVTVTRSISLSGDFVTCASSVGGVREVYSCAEDFEFVEGECEPLDGSGTTNKGNKLVIGGGSPDQVEDSSYGGIVGGGVAGVVALSFIVLVIYRAKGNKKSGRHVSNSHDDTVLEAIPADSNSTMTDGSSTFDVNDCDV